MFVGEDKGDKVGNGVGVGRHLKKGAHHWSDHSALLSVLVDFFLEWACVAWCCALLQIEFPCLLILLPVDFLLPFGDNCARQARALCWVLVITRLGLHVC